MKIWQRNDLLWECVSYETIKGNLKFKYHIELSRIPETGKMSLSLWDYDRWIDVFWCNIQSKGDLDSASTYAPFNSELMGIAYFVSGITLGAKGRIWKTASHWNFDKFGLVGDRPVRYSLSTGPNSEGSVKVWAGSGWREILWVPEKGLICRKAYSLNTEKELLSGAPFLKDLEWLEHKTADILLDPDYRPEKDITAVNEEIANDTYSSLCRIGPHRCHLYIHKYKSYVWGEITIGKETVFSQPIDATVENNDFSAARDLLIGNASTLLF